MPKNATILVTMSEIEAYTSRPGKTIKAWVKKHNFPAVKIDGRWESNTELIDSFQKRRIEELSLKRQNESTGSIEVHQTEVAPGPAPTERNFT